jgi:hypothetical protein
VNCQACVGDFLFRPPARHARTGLKTRVRVRGGSRVHGRCVT